MAAGVIITTVLACFVNAFVLLPAYGKAFGMPVQAFIEMGAAVHSGVTNLLTFCNYDSCTIQFIQIHINLSDRVLYL